MASEIPADVQPIDVALHTRFYQRHLQVLPYPYVGQDSGRLPLLYFCLSSLDLLGTLDQVLLPEDKKAVIDWIYSLQVHPVPKGAGEGEGEDVSRCGFRGSPYLGFPFAPGSCGCEEHQSPQQQAPVSAEAPAAAAAASQPHPYDGGHLAMTYAALCCLRVLDDDLSRVNRGAILGSLKHLQTPEGSFSPTWQGGEADMRFLFCAAAIVELLRGDWSEFDTKLACDFVAASQSYDGGIGLRPGSEGHGGSTYTAISALTMMRGLDRLRDLPGLVRWCVRSQGAGFCGRPNKPADSCYSYWIGATMKLLGIYELTNRPENRRFNLRCETPIGGFGKHPGVHPDLLHAYFGLSGLSLVGWDGLRPLNVHLGLSTRVAGSAGLSPEAAAYKQLIDQVSKELQAEEQSRREEKAARTSDAAQASPEQND